MRLSTTECIALAGVIVATVTAIAALINYQHQTRTKTAEFLLTLHKSFFVEDFYKEIREKIDHGSEEDIVLLVSHEPAAFTDFLNFFELVAYMQEIGTLSWRDVRALLGYYLDELQRQPVLRTYIAKPEHGFENLNSLLRKR